MRNSPVCCITIQHIPCHILRTIRTGFIQTQTEYSRVNHLHHLGIVLTGIYNLCPDVCPDVPVLCSEVAYRGIGTGCVVVQDVLQVSLDVCWGYNAT